ncbi:MAG: bifunctional DNA-formamidopyrimidine glycosylase/DNA-(apurinic or apyrimidinic site) lyase [Alphaproteobacteria bacterium]|nr:bifunctional DNA-formamidopyrimidine glycosylase/DNA-(apurinic or apyrimidinic site) lyase [Alphaproteobacteria bacterium]
MPELPEVETVRLGLAPVLEGHTLTRVSQRRADLRIPFPQGFVSRLTGRTVVRLVRRAKYLLAHLDSGEVLLMHLGMSGRFTIHASASAMGSPGRHDHVIFETEAGTRIVFADHRRFGLMTLINEGELGVHKLLAALGPEPLTPAFSPSILCAVLTDKRTAIKSALLDQRVVAGLGNIYVCEVLFRAGVSPRRLSSLIERHEAEKIVKKVKLVLRSAIKSGGSTLRDYKTTSGELGYFQHKFRVYDRADENCVNPGCHGVVQRIMQSGRSTFFCAQCQR